MTADRRTPRAAGEIAELFDVPDEACIIAIAWPTGRPVYRYSAAELADGVDLYTRAMKARAASTGPAGGDDAS